MTSVARTTQKAVSTTVSRWGKLSGKANAVAMVTKPRMPHQPPKQASRSLGGAGWFLEEAHQASKRLKPMTTARRVQTTATTTITAKVKASRRCAGCSRARMDLACIPMSRKANTFKVKTTELQTANDCTRMRASNATESLMRERVMAKVMTHSTAER